MNTPENSPQPQARCQKLRSKEMYYKSPGEDDDAYSGGVYWCTKTHEGFGPDGEPVGKAECCAGRSCFIG
jgi:hypothetical protein